MSSFRLARWMVAFVCGALLAAGCTTTSDSPQGDTGSLALDLVIGDGIVINEVDWTITGGDMEPMSGTIYTSAPGATASVEVYGLPPTDGEDYTVMLEAVSEDGETTCKGSTDFGVDVGQVTEIMVFLNCKPPQRLGAVRVNGKFNICAELVKAVVSPLQTSVGNDIDLSAIGQDVESDSIHYIWSGTGGSIDDPNAANTTYTCQEVGNQSISITISDDDFEYCMDSWTVAVTCVLGDDGDLCEGVNCDDQNDCSNDECDPASGQCVNEPVDDGTSCDGGEGVCEAGACVPADLCEGVDCNDDNECTTDTCDPATGECSNAAVDDGTECNGGAGMCVGGQCMDVDLCEGVNCDDTVNECTVAACNVQNGQCEDMNVPDGTECNGGAGACSAGVCVDNDLCEGVDCTSANQCVQGGACEPSSGECIPGGNQPVDTACDQSGGSVCDGQGNCVECNSAAQCPDDVNECTTATCDGNACGQQNVADGMACDFDGMPGVCEAGACVAAPECISPGDCNDGNPCTIGDCPDGMCVFTPVADGSTCEVSAGVPGQCSAGDCVGLCEGVDCASSNQCVMDGACELASGECLPGDNQPADTGCDQGGGSVCDGQGNCVECNSAAQCPDDGNECTTATCDGSACGQQNVTDGTACDGGSGVCNAGFCEPAVTCEYEQDFEGLDPATADALASDGWLYFGNVFDSTGGFKFGFGPFVAPTTSGQISGIASGEGGPDQGNNQLVVFSNYDCCQPGEGHFGTDLVETIVFQEIKPIPADFIGKVFTFEFDAKAGNIGGATTAQAFIRTLDPGAGFATTNNIVFDTTALPTGWGTYSISIDLSDPALQGQILQFGFSTVAQNFEGAGNFYDNASFCSAGGSNG